MSLETWKYVVLSEDLRKWSVKLCSLFSLVINYFIRLELLVIELGSDWQRRIMVLFRNPQILMAC